MQPDNASRPENSEALSFLENTVNNGTLFDNEDGLALRLGISVELLRLVHEAESIRSVQDPATGQTIYDSENAAYCLRVFIDGQSKAQP